MFDWRLDVDGQVVQFEMSGGLPDGCLRAPGQPVHPAVRRRSEPVLPGRLDPGAARRERRHPERNPRPAPRHRGTFDDLPLPIPPSFNEADVSDKPSFIPPAPLARVDLDRMERRHRDRLTSLLAVDELVGTVSDALRKAGEVRNTYVISTSDNGYLEGEHRVRKKTLLYEESVECR